MLTIERSPEENEIKFCLAGGKMNPHMSSGIMLCQMECSNFTITK